MISRRGDIILVGHGVWAVGCLPRTKEQSSKVYVKASASFLIQSLGLCLNIHAGTRLISKYSLPEEREDMSSFPAEEGLTQ